MLSQHQLIERLYIYEKEKEDLREFQDEMMVTLNQYLALDRAGFQQESLLWKKLETRAWPEMRYRQYKLRNEAFLICSKLKSFFKNRNDLRSVLEVHLIEQYLKYCKELEFFWHPSFDVIFEQLGHNS